MSFLPTIEIDASALRHNLGVVRKHAPGSRVMAVIKADGYGHGMLEVAHALEDADALAVARVDEGVLLRQHQPSKRLLVLAGAHDRAEMEAAAQAGLEVVIHHAEQIEALSRAKLARPLGCWIKLDTGMHRLGFPPYEFRLRLEQLRELPAVAEVAGVLTHLANADDLGDDYTRTQLARFNEATGESLLPASVANSAGILGWPDTHAHWVRPGIMLYGASPFATPVQELEPVMSFRSRLIAVKEVAKGSPVGYGGEWVAPEEMRIGVAAAGYGDGYPREVPSGTPVLVRGQRVPRIGRVSMDTLILDLRELPHARVGDEVLLWGPGLPAEEIAAAANTIPYTLFCGITARVVRGYRE
ncbi:MAG: alanine racemase [Gammaproteobacteria bacterium]|nr:MAG: alanine racemase [Gammaproteobacteria bacterium]RTZ75639.1 MAG: alanine racemase [Gammaproteobacteria bacterium]